MNLDYIWLVPVIVLTGALSWLFPFLAAILYSFRTRGRVQSMPPSRSKYALEVLIPAFNEEQTISRTLESVFEAIEYCLNLRPQLRFKVTVALDGSKDATRSNIEKFLSARKVNSRVEFNLLDRGYNLGKWATLSELTSQSEAQWCAFVDSGSLWPRNFIERLLPYMNQSRVVGLAPGYKKNGASILERLIWLQERILKSLEGLAGGPITLHGATMVLRGDVVRAAFSELGKRSWLNDDVVLGLTLRKYGEVKYFGNSLTVSDCGARVEAVEFNRRRRILLGNIEWIREIFLGVSIENPVVGLLALRRVMRLFWAYHLILISASFGMFFNNIGVLLLTAFLGVGPFILSQRLRGAFFVSLLAPLYILNPKSKVSWV